MAPQREWFEKDYYKVLGVPQAATETEIRRAYRKLAKQNHPDANPGKEERFKEISAAYDVLSEPAKRKEYDEIRRLGPMAAAGGAGRPGAPGQAGAPFNVRSENLGDLFGDLLGRFGVVQVCQRHSEELQCLDPFQLERDHWSNYNRCRSRSDH